METVRTQSKTSHVALRFAISIAALIAFFGLASGCSGKSDKTASSTPTVEAAAPTQAAAATPPSYIILSSTPDSGFVGTEFTVAGEGLPANEEGELIWATYNGRYDMDASAENVAFLAKKYDATRVSLGTVKVGADGTLKATFKAPEDYGELHDLYLSIKGEDVAKGGFRIQRQIKISPESGPIGTPITITATGLGYKPYESIVAIRYDNAPTGIVTAITTRGTAVATIRASGKTGRHVIDANHGARSVPYLNNQQAGTAHIPDFRFWFTVTDDSVMPPDSMEWPDDAYLAKPGDVATLTTRLGSASESGNAVFEPGTGPILSKTTLKVSGLDSNTDAEVFWVTARGNRVSSSGWSLAESSLGVFTSDKDGNLEATVEVPDDLGGWHVAKVVSKGEVFAEVPFYVEHSIVGITPRKVKAGDVIEVRVKGIGWTELDNGVAITYDNNYIGFACGFNSIGDVTVYLVATGEPGIHLVSMYPMIYQGHGEPPWGYQQAILTFAQDAPGLQLGYRLPAMHMAFEIVE